MDETDLERVHEGERIAVLRAIGAQARELDGAERTVTCPCGDSCSVRFMFQCLYCEVWFCRRCAEEHFGEGEP